MPRGPQTPLWWRVVDAIEDHLAMKRRHRADGRVTPEEEQAEETHLTVTVFAVAVDSADCLSIAQAVGRGGPESDHAQRLLRDRARRRADAARFGGGDQAA